MYWISGIGSNKGLFYFQYQQGLLLCVNDNNKLLYKNDQNYDCVYYDYDFNSSINETKTSTIDLYPNPTYDKFVIKSTEIIKNITVFNSIGKLIISKSPNITDFTMDLSNYVNGLYIVQINNETIKFIKE